MERRRPEFQLVLCGTVSVWAWENQACGDSFSDQEKGKHCCWFPQGFESEYLSVFWEMHIFSSSRNFPLPDSPHQIRWNRFFSFGKRLECCFILLAHFSAQSEKSKIYRNRMKKYLTALESGGRGEKPFKNATWSPKETNSNWWKGYITELQREKTGVLLSLFTIIRVCTIEFSIGTTILYIWKKTLNYLNSIHFL